jgi:hypothetical protein
MIMYLSETIRRTCDLFLSKASQLSTSGTERFKQGCIKQRQTKGCRMLPSFRPFGTERFKQGCIRQSLTKVVECFLAFDLLEQRALKKDA